MSRLLIIDDDAAVRDAMRETLLSAGYQVEEAASGRQGLTALQESNFDGVILDLRMPGLDGLDVLRRLEGRLSKPRIAVLTAHATSDNTIEAMRLGAYDHLTKPISRADLLAVAAKLAEAKPGLRPEPKLDVFEGMIGVSPAIREVQKTIGRVADSSTAVLITGETGTGKELVANALHRFGNRSSKPMIALNCAAVPAELMESELFGHKKGAFTGALGDRAGAFVEANGGILFLDEIGDMPHAMQVKMLRVLQEQTVTPIGGKPQKVNVRVVAATHRDLEAAVREGHFREDLYFRLNVVPIHVPTLRERSEDIIPLAKHFLASTSRAQDLSPEASKLLLAYSWPGNVRELRNAIDRASLLARHTTLTEEDFFFLMSNCAATSDGVAPAESLPSAVEKLEIALVKRAIEAAKGNRAEAARMLGIPRQQLYVKIRKYGL